MVVNYIMNFCMSERTFAVAQVHRHQRERTLRDQKLHSANIAVTWNASNQQEASERPVNLPSRWNFIVLVITLNVRWLLSINTSTMVYLIARDQIDNNSSWQSQANMYSIALWNYPSYLCFINIEHICFMLVDSRCLIHKWFNYIIASWLIRYDWSN